MSRIIDSQFNEGAGAEAGFSGVPERLVEVEDVLAAPSVPLPCR